MIGGQRYFINLSFKGTNYHGWQIQPKATSVQQVLNEALYVLLHDTISTIGAGRTDAGVHARIFTAHFDSKDPRLNEKSEQIIKGLNAILPEDIAIHDLFAVKQGVHARFSAVKRIYKYTILLRKNPFLNDFGWLCRFNLNTDKMNEAVKLILNYSDFSSFKKLHSNERSNNCKIFSAGWEKFEDRLVFTICADRFLRNMVRAMVGTLVDIGRGKIEINEIERIIGDRNRNSAGFSVPAKGLELYQIEYPVNIALPLPKKNS